jgi:hypothetical protein
MLPAALIWLLVTPVYNLFLIQSAENLVRLTEFPSQTRLQARDTHYMVINRADLPAPKGKAWLYSVRVSDVHFPLIMLTAFFLAVPGVSLRRRLESLGWALLLSIFFHIISLLFWVKFAYATQLGDWSGEHYGSLGSNAWGLGKHLLDLPFKFAMPLLLWAVFFLRQLLPDEEKA